MPGKYSYNAVLSDFSSQGLIPLPNDKQIDSQRESESNRPTRSRSHSALNGGPAPVSSVRPGQRIVIRDSDSEDDAPEPPQRPQARSVPIRQTRPKHAEQRKHVRIEKPLPSTPRKAIPEPRRTGGVRAFIAARHQEELSALTEPESSAPEISLHEFLDSVPRSPERARRQPRQAHLMSTRSSGSSHVRDLSVSEFLNLVPNPPPEVETKVGIGERSPVSSVAKALPLGSHPPMVYSRKPPVSPDARASPLVSRLPRGIELSTRQPLTPPSTEKKSRTPAHAKNASTSRRSLGSERPIGSPIPERKTSIPASSNVTRTAKMTSPILAVASRTTESELRRGQPEKSPPQEHFGTDYDLDFDGFTDQESSYFPRMDSINPKPAPAKRLETRHSRSLRHTKVIPSRNKRDLNTKPAATPPISPQESTFQTDDQLSPGHESNTTYDQSIRSAKPPLNSEQKQGTSGSWSLPAIKKSESDTNSFSNMFEDKAGRNILIFTSDEEDKDGEDDSDEDDLPTPRVQKLEVDPSLPSTEWGMISAGKQFNPNSKDSDSMSDLSAVYPPDIGRHYGGDESPLDFALQSMQHGGELGASAYKQQQSRFALRKTINTSEILGRLGLRRSSTISDKGIIIAGSASGKSKTQARPPYHPASSSRARLPMNK
jgi:hypothetical protein